MAKKIMFIDGLSIANRAFYGIPLLTNSEGQYTNAIYGFLNIMLSLIEKEKPDLLGIAFDVSKPTFRHVQNKDYKGTRKGMLPELKSQIPVLKEVLNKMNIEMMECEGFEADDILGTMAKNFESKGYDVVIVSGDRDLLQLASEKIMIKIPKTKQGGTEVESYLGKDVTEKYEVSPKTFIDLKGLMGDSSDNIKGVPGVGEKTAIKLLKAYGSMEGIYENIDEITQKKLKENLITYKDQAFESKMLATIVIDVPIEREEESFSYTLQLNFEAEKLFKKLDFKKLIARMQPENQSENSAMTVIENIMSIDEQFIEEGVISISMYTDEETVYIAVTNGEQYNYSVLKIEDEYTRSIIQKLFENEKTYKILHDTKSIRHILSKWNVTIKGEFSDTLLAAYLCNPTEDSYTLSELAREFSEDCNVDSLDGVLGKGKNKKILKEIDETVLSQILCHEAQVLKNIWPKIKNKLEDENMLKLYEEIELPLAEVLFEMEYEGITIDPEMLKKYGDMLSGKIEATAKEVYELAGEEFNINSPKQLGIVLFEKMDIPPVKKTKTGYSTAAEVLDTLKVNYPIVEHILAYRQYTKLKSTYVDGLLAVMKEDNKIHSTFNQTITATGRMSSTDPNLQNIPIRLELGKKIREVFIPKSEEYVFLDADYSQIELRILAAMSKDEVLIDAFNKNIDIHRLTASQVFHTAFEDVTATQRSNAKAVNFGIVYGIGAFSLAQDLGISPKEAGEYIEGYFEKYPKIKKYLDSVIAEAKLYGEVETLFHRKRMIPDIHSSNHNVREFAKRKAMNTPIQGTAADIIKIAMIRVSKALKENKLKSKLILTVHDELLLEVYKPEVEVVATLLKTEMENAASLDVCLSVDVHEGNNWLAVK
ncbi:MAG: DNA polymerase I [Cellulosilyticaceae bacterium]